MDKVRTPPTSIGRRGRFWEVPLASARSLEAVKNNPDETSVAVIIVEAPYANMHVHSFLLSIVHLRPILGREPPHISLPGATHEICLIPLDPAIIRDPIVRGDAIVPIRKETKITFIGQVIQPSDDAARDLLLATAQDVADARLNPDKDYLKWWAARFGANSLKPGWDRWSDKFIVGGKEIIVPLKPLPGETDKPSPA